MGISCAQHFPFGVKLFSQHTGRDCVGQVCREVVGCRLVQIVWWRMQVKTMLDANNKMQFLGSVFVVDIKGRVSS